MKKVIAAAMIAGSLCLVAPASAHEPDFNDGYEDALMHPLRLAYYAIHPIGFAAEWLIGRPVQYVISRDGWSRFFGYKPLDDSPTYSSVSSEM